MDKMGNLTNVIFLENDTTYSEEEIYRKVAMADCLIQRQGAPLVTRAIQIDTFCSEPGISCSVQYSSTGQEDIANHYSVSAASSSSRGVTESD